MSRVQPHERKLHVAFFERVEGSSVFRGVQPARIPNLVRWATVWPVVICFQARFLTFSRPPPDGGFLTCVCGSSSRHRDHRGGI